MDQGDPANGHLDGKPPQRSQQAKEDEAEEVPEGEEEEDAGDGEDEGPGEDLQDSSEEEEEGEGNEYDVTDKFLVADDDAEDGGDGVAEGTEGSAKRKKKRRRRRESDEELDEEDYELIGQRPPRKGQHKRIRKLTEPAAGRHHISAEDIREELFGKDDDDNDLQDVDEDEAAAQRQAERQRERQRQEDDLDPLEDEDEFADFLVDDEEGEKTGEPRRRRRALAKALPAGVSAEAFQEAQDIFGDADELLEDFRAHARPRQQEPLDEDEDLDAEDLGDDDEARADRLRAIEERRKAREMKKIAEKVEPEMLAKAMLRGEDDVIRTMDLPEREQLKPSPEPRGWGVVDPPTMLDTCAAWIHKQLLPEEDKAAEDEPDSDRASALRQAQALETQLLLTGRREIDGPMEGSSGGYPPDYLVEDVRDLSRGQRAVRDARSHGGVDKWRQDASEQENLKQSIKSAVNEMFDKHNEVPFLAMYRKQVLGELLCGRAEDMPDVIKRESSRLPTGYDIGMVQAKHRRIRRWDILWKVYDLAAQWRALARRQEARQAAYIEAIDRPEATKDDKDAMDHLLDQLTAADSPEALADIEAKFRVTMAASNGRLEDAMEAVALHDGRRRPGRRSNYEILLKAGLEPIVRQIYLKAEGFGANLDLNYRSNEVAEVSLEPREFAEQYTNQESTLGKPELVLSRAAEMAICELVAEPQVRKAVREPFLKRALVSTEPTPQGEQLLDPFHLCGRVKRLRDKPVQSFAGSDTFLRIAQAEKEGLIEVRIDINAQVLEDIIQNMIKLYQSPQQTRIAKAWNAIRADTLRRAIMERLLPSFAVELRSKLLAEAQEAVLLQVSDKLWDWASQAPTQVQTGDESTVVEHRRFAAVCWGPGDPATTMVMLNEHGQLVDVLYAGQLSGSIRRTRRNAQGVDDIFSDSAKSKDAERIRDFLVQHTPHKIFLGGACMQCVQLYEDLQKVLDHILDRMPSAFTRTETGYIELNWADESLAALWETSESAKQEMGDQLPLVRRAIALARCKLEPLAVLSALCGPSAEILSMDLHPLKELVPRQALLRAAERICITAVNQVGLDVNVVAHSAWLAAPLQFVAGLGPRKSQLLSRAVQREEFVQTRSDLYKGLGVLGKHVFRNCGGPLLITASSDEVSLEDLDPLDATRITPVLYVYAKGLARAIVDPGAEEEAGKHHVREAQSRPNDVEGFDLLEYSKQLKEAEGRDHLTTLRDVAFELAAPGAELRRQRESFKVTEVLYMLCGESAETLKEGREVSAVVTFAGSRDVLVRLPDFGDAEGVITEVASDYGNPVQPRDRFVRDQAIRVRVNSLVASESSSNISKLSVILVDEEDLDSNDVWEERYCREVEPWYHILTREERQKARDEKKRALKSRQLINRPIWHPYFKNLSALQTAEALRDADVGACLFTPSTRGTDQITLTMKVHKRTDDGLISDIYLSKEVKEGPKGSAVGAHLKLGKPLEIVFLGAKGGSEHYEDLDEILARFVEPYVAQLKQIKGHRKYREGPAKHVEAQLKQEKKQMGAKGAAYVLGAKQESPGVFYVAYIANVTPHREYMTVTPDGVYFRSEVRKNIEHVLYLFKKNPAGERASMQAEPQAPPPPAAPRVNRFSAQPPAAPPGGPSGMPAAGPGAVQPIKPAWLTASQPQQAQQPHWGAPPPPAPAGNEWGAAQSGPAGNAWAPAQPAPARNAWAPAHPASAGNANGYPHNAPPPPPQLPAPGYSQAYGRR